MNTLLVVSEDERRRTSDVERLFKAGEVARLVDSLADTSWTVRRAAVSALARLGDAAVAPLCAVLRGKRDDEATLAATVDTLVASLGDVDAAVLALTDTDVPAVVCDGAQILGRRKAVGAIAKLAALTQHADDNVALAAIEAVGRIGGEAAVDVLITAVRSESFFRVFPAIDVLGRTGDLRAVGPLCAMLAEPRYLIEAARALGHAAQPKAAAQLAALLVKPNDAQVRVAAAALVEIDDRYSERFGPNSAVPDALRGVDAGAASRRLTQALVGADAIERKALCRVLGWVGGNHAVRGLVELLDAEPAAAQAAASAIAKLGIDVEPLLLGALRDSPSERRLLLLPILARLKSAAPEIVACLDDAHPNVRASACDALGKIGDHTVVPALFQRLGDADARVSQAAVAALQSLGGAETERLALEAAGSSDPRIRRSALRILSYFGWPSGLEVFLAAMGADDERVRDVAAAGLAAIDDDRAVAALVTAAELPSARTRAAAVRALGQTRDAPSVRERLRAALTDSDAWVRYYACQSLSRIKDEGAVDAIRSLLADPAGHVRVAAIDALARLRGQQALEALHAAAGSLDPDLQRAALLGIGSVKNPASLGILRGALGASDPATRLVALSALSEFGERDGLAGIRDAMTDADETVRHAAVGLLASRPGVEATQALIGQLGNPNIRDRVLAALAQPVEGRVSGVVAALLSTPAESADLVSALARMRRPDATAALEDAFSGDNAFLRRVIVPALAALGTPSTRELLRRAASEDDDEQVRQLCVAALNA